MENSGRIIEGKGNCRRIKSVCRRFRMFSGSKQCFGFAVLV